MIIIRDTYKAVPPVAPFPGELHVDTNADYRREYDGVELNRDGKWYCLRVLLTNRLLAKISKEELPKHLTKKDAIKGYLFAHWEAARNQAIYANPPEKSRG